jgi:hypothetical protein
MAVRLSRVKTGHKYQAMVRPKGTDEKPVLLTVERVWGREIDPEFPQWIIYTYTEDGVKRVVTNDGHELFDSMYKVRFLINRLYERCP